MSLGLNSDQITAMVAVLTLVGGAGATIIGWFLHAKDEAQAKEIEAIKENHGKDIKNIESAHNRDMLEHGKEMARLQDSCKATWSVIDKLKEERSNFWTRSEHEQWRKEMRAEMKADITDMGSRLIAEIEKVSQRFADEIRHVEEKIK